MADIKKSCKHEHECEKCIREEITKLEAKLKELKAKLPSTQIINICNHGCSHWPCNHWYGLQSQYKVPYIVGNGTTATYTVTGANSISFLNGSSSGSQLNNQ